MADLADRDCVPCRRGQRPLTADAIAPLLAQLEGWRVVDDHHLEKVYRLADFAEGLRLVNAIGAIAEAQNHHPDLELAWGRVGVKVFTHAIDGLAENDFVLAAKCDRAARDLAPPRHPR